MKNPPTACTQATLLHWLADSPLPVRPQGATKYDSGGRSYVKCAPTPPPTPSDNSPLCSIGSNGTNKNLYATMSIGSEVINHTRKTS